mmetsp:Transcript_17351/g.36157  ORF Transcript_17351/g.36157 Transcript_17351/m.36157 type:complete len:204 (-) Transcript_17351:319-930(-)
MSKIRGINRDKPLGLNQQSPSSLIHTTILAWTIKTSNPIKCMAVLKFEMKVPKGLMINPLVPATHLTSLTIYRNPPTLVLIAKCQASRVSRGAITMMKARFMGNLHREAVTSVINTLASRAQKLGSKIVIIQVAMQVTNMVASKTMEAKVAVNRIMAAKAVNKSTTMVRDLLKANKTGTTMENQDLFQQRTCLLLDHLRDCHQ